MTTFNPLTDYSLADLPATDQQIERSFRELPWCQRILANGRLITRKEWIDERVRQNGHKVYQVT